MGVGAFKVIEGGGHIICRLRASVRSVLVWVAASCTVISDRVPRIVAASFCDYGHVGGFRGDKGYFAC